MGSVIIEPSDIVEEYGALIGNCVHEVKSQSLHNHGEVYRYPYTVSFPDELQKVVAEAVRRRRPIRAAWRKDVFRGGKEIADSVQVL